MEFQVFKFTKSRKKLDVSIYISEMMVF